MVMIDGWVAGKIDRGEGDEEDDDLGYTHHMTDKEEEEEEEEEDDFMMVHKLQETSNTPFQDFPFFDLSFASTMDCDDMTKRTGTIWTASAHIITDVFGIHVLSMAWAIAQLGWIVGPVALFLFSIVIYYTSAFLADCYHNPSNGERNYTYMGAVRNNLGGAKGKICGFIQYLELFGGAIECTIVASTSMMAIKRSNCFHTSEDENPCHTSSNPYIIMFGVSQIVFSQIPDSHEIWWLSIAAVAMSFTYSSIALGLGIAKASETRSLKGSLTGISSRGPVTMTEICTIFRALGLVAFACSFSSILMEVQDTIKSPPSEAKTMKKATLLSIIVTMVFCMLCGCMGYAAFGDLAPENLLSGFGFYNPYWLLDIANAAIVIHMVGAYQVGCQPLFAFIEKVVREGWPRSEFITYEIKIPVACFRTYRLNLFCLLWRSAFVTTTTLISMLIPLSSDVAAIFSTFGFWPLTIYFPVEMYIAEKKIDKWSTRWVCLHIISFACLIISITAAAGSVANVVHEIKKYKPFKTRL